MLFLLWSCQYDETDYPFKGGCWKAQAVITAAISPLYFSPTIGLDLPSAQNLPSHPLR
jgi:hypothetical protein